MDSKPLDIRTKDTLVIPIINPGGNIHHHIPLAAAFADCASCRITPQVGIVGSPSPMKLNPDSPKIAVGTDNAIVAKAKGNNWGMICLKIIRISDSPINFAASTYG